MDEFQHKPQKNIQQSDSWHVLKILSEFVDGFDIMNNIGPSVTIFGSARIAQGSEYYRQAQDMAYKIAQKGFGIITGGGPGIMEAANYGAQQAGGISLGMGVELPFETDLNSYISPKYRMSFRYFFVRKVMLIKHAQAFVFMPGGFGTLDELFEVVTLIQTKKIKPAPIFLIGSQYWNKMVCWIEDVLVKDGYVASKDVDMFKVTDDVDSMIVEIERYYNNSISTDTYEI